MMDTCKHPPTEGGNSPPYCASSLQDAGDDLREQRIDLLSEQGLLESMGYQHLGHLIPLALIGLCTIGRSEVVPTVVLIALQLACLAAMFVVCESLRVSDNPSKGLWGWRSYNLLNGCSGAVWAGLMLPVMATLGTDITSAFVCVIIIATVSVTTMVIASRWTSFTYFFLGFFLALVPQTVYFLDDIGPLPLLASLVFAPVLLGLAKAASKQSRSLIHSQLEKEELAAELACALEKAEFLASRDSLTGLYNRRAFEEIADRLAAVSANHPICLVLIDLDHFKSINDRYGHARGDSVLKRSAQLIVTTMEPMDILGCRGQAVARWGGEEFIMLLPGCPLPMALQIAERLRSKLEQLSDPTWPADLTVTGSFGVSRWRPETGMHQCIKNADQAMYRAKRWGRNRVTACLNSNEASDGPALAYPNAAARR